MKINRRPIYPDIKASDYNNHGLKEYTPYIIDINGTMVIEYEWWESLTSYIKNLIIKKIKTFVLGTVNIPHEEQYDLDDDIKGKQLTIVYQSYLDGFDYNIWYDNSVSQYPRNVEIVYFDIQEKNVLLETSQRGISEMKNPSDIVIISNIKQKIKTCIEKLKCNNDVVSFFVRLSGTSGKNEKPVQEYYNEHDIFNHLTTCDLFTGREYKRDKQVCLILMPFNEYIESKYEFRMFIVNKKLVAVCQQKWWELFNYSSDELDIFEESFLVLEKEYIINENKSESQQFRSYILDVYVNIDKKRCDIIEINPFGAHSGAGAGLFNWINDYDLLHGKFAKDGAEFRYLSMVDI